MMFPLYRYGSITINEARLQAGFSLPEVLELFEISQSTWYRWKQSGAPRWAFRLLECHAGHLDHLGWKGWQIRHGRLFSHELHYRYYWQRSDLLIHAHGLSPNVIPQSIRASANAYSLADHA